MLKELKAQYSDYAKVILSFLFTFLCVRLFEYLIVARKLLVVNSSGYEFMGLLYDIWFVLIYGLILFPIIYLISKMNQGLGKFILHVLNLFMLTAYLSLIIVFSQRSSPFDHELFIRSQSEILISTKQMMATGFIVFLPFLIYFFIYYLSNKWVFGKIKRYAVAVPAFFYLSLAATAGLIYAKPDSGIFDSRNAYYLTCNKFSYWIADSYQYLKNKNKYDQGQFSADAIRDAISFYQQHQPLHFISNEYPLLHKNDEPDVLGDFFNLDPNSPPNIVIIVTEGLADDFSGGKAYATSFTPFLDSLSKHSLSWDNFLSVSPGTFSAHPAIEGSLPYGKKGFSAINVMPDHLSLIKLLKGNGYHTKFLTGSNTDFDNMGGFIRLQGTDLSLLPFSAKYKEMAKGSEGWTMGYPDDALFNRSMEVMDSLPQEPYLNIYHTATTHMPYLFDQKPEYDKRFDAKMKHIPVSPEVKKTVMECKDVLVTYMFADDCFRELFRKYSKRTDFKNTIFFITGDHHIGSFPSTSGIDDYHVPLIVYSPMLKHPQEFHAVNSHNNLAPTIASLVLNNYPKLSYRPAAVNWVGTVMDTAVQFRNTQSMPFMYSNREIGDYIWKDYFLSDKVLYKLSPTLEMIPYKNDSIKTYLSQLLENYKIINSYVCDNNKIFPSNEWSAGQSKTLLYEFIDSANKKVDIHSTEFNLMKDLHFDRNYTYLGVDISADVKIDAKNMDDQPAFRFSFVDESKHARKYLFYTTHELALIAKGSEFRENDWNKVGTKDMLTLNDYKSNKNLAFNLALFSTNKIELEIKKLKLRIYGIK